MKQRIKEKLSASFNLILLEIEDQSYLHAGHSGSREEGETHFKLKIVSDDFIGQDKVTRHRMVYHILQQELKERIHALSINALTKTETQT
jgi:BolA protein